MFFLSNAIPSMDFSTLMTGLAGAGIVVLVGVLVLIVVMILINSAILWGLAKLFKFEKPSFLRAVLTVIANLILGIIAMLIVSIPFMFLKIPFLPVIISQIVNLAITTILIKFIMGTDWVKALIATIILLVIGFIIGFVLMLLFTVLALGGLFTMAAPMALH